MTILALNSSHRGRKGFTQVLLDRMQAGAEAAGAAFETVALAERRINRCLGCEACHTPQRPLRCVYEDKDDMKAILEKMAACDIVIFATPVYVFAMSGLMKTFLDRINSTGDTNTPAVSKYGLFFHPIDAAICSKPFVLLTTCGNMEDETVSNVISYFCTYSKFMDAPIAGMLARKTSFLLENKSESELPGKAAVLEAFREAGKELAEKGKISRETTRQATRNVLDIPPAVMLLSKIRPLKAVLLRKALEKNLLHFK